ncbi:MAG: hypothetical protein ABUL60_05195 [Myxococcales bacterium]
MHVAPTVSAASAAASLPAGHESEEFGEQSAALNSGHGIAYNGGHVMSGVVHAYFIWYGNWANNPTVSLLSELVPNLSYSPYYNINTLYDDNFGGRVSGALTLAGATSDAYSLGSNLSLANITTIVSSAISTNKLPKDTNGVYFVLTSADVQQSNAADSAFCGTNAKGYCGWHTSTTISGSDIKFAFVGNGVACPAVCSTPSPSPNGNPGGDEMANVLAHELEEAVTDPDLNAWTDPGVNENADKCAWSFGATYTTSNGAQANMKLGTRDYRIQKNWLNTGAGSCGLTYGAELTWGPWQSLGEASTLPVGAAGFGGAMHLFAVESGGVIGHNGTVDGSPWSAWTHELNGTTNVAIGAAAFAGNLHLFAKGGADGRVYHRWAAQGQAFNAWSSEISGTTNVPLTAASLGNFLHLFRVDTNNNLMHCSAATGQAFGPWEQLDGTTNAAVAATTLGTRLHVFAKGIGDSHVYHRSAQDGQPFGAWEDLGGATNAAPATATVQPGPAGGADRILMVTAGTDNHMYYRLAQDGFGFGNWLQVPGGPVASVSAARLGANTYVFATGTDGQVRVSQTHL